MTSTCARDQPNLYSHRPIDYSKWDALKDSDDDCAVSVSHYSEDAEDDEDCGSDEDVYVCPHECCAHHHRRKVKPPFNAPGTQFNPSNPPPAYYVSDTVTDYQRVAPLEHHSEPPNLDAHGYPKSASYPAAKDASFNIGFPPMAGRKKSAGGGTNRNSAPNSTPANPPPPSSFTPPFGSAASHQPAPAPPQPVYTTSHPDGMPPAGYPKYVHNITEEMRHLNMKWGSSTGMTPPENRNKPFRSSHGTGWSQPPGAFSSQSPTMENKVKSSEELMRELLEEEERAKEAASGKKKKKKKKTKKASPAEEGTVGGTQTPDGANGASQQDAPSSGAASSGQGKSSSTSSTGLASGGSGGGKKSKKGGQKSNASQKSSKQASSAQQGSSSGDDTDDGDDNSTALLSNPSNAFALLAMVDEDDDIYYEAEQDEDPHPEPRSRKDRPRRSPGVGNNSNNRDAQAHPGHPKASHPHSSYIAPSSSARHQADRTPPAAPPNKLGKVMRPLYKGRPAPVITVGSSNPHDASSRAHGPAHAPPYSSPPGIETASASSGASTQASPGVLHPGPIPAGSTSPPPTYQPQTPVPPGLTRPVSAHHTSTNPHARLGSYNPVAAGRHAAAAATAPVPGQSDDASSSHPGPQPAPRLRSYHQVYAQYLQQQGRGTPPQSSTAPTAQPAMPLPVPSAAHIAPPQQHNKSSGSASGHAAAASRLEYSGPSWHAASGAASAESARSGYSRVPRPTPLWQVDSMGQVVHELDDDHVCVVCMEQPRDVLLIPCGHAVLCIACCSEIRGKSDMASCPICRVCISDAVVI